jgi:uncharacterized protein (TIGR03000 family)
MKTMTRIAMCLLVLLSLSAWNSAQEKQVETVVTILVPPAGEEETKVKVNGKELEGEGGTRTFKAISEKGKDVKLKIEALIVPNNYTKITRIREITIKGGDQVKVDLNQKQAFAEQSHPDDIVVRFVPTPDDIVDEMSKLAKIGKDDVVWDLGCGDAVMLIRPIQKFGAKLGVGVEYDPKVMEIAKENVKKAKLEDKIIIKQGDMLKVTEKDMADATVVLLYIGDDLGERVSPVLQRALKPGSRVVSHRFSLGDWKPSKSITIKGKDGDDYDLHLWIVGEKRAEKKIEAKQLDR